MKAFNFILQFRIAIYSISSFSSIDLFLSPIKALKTIIKPAIENAEPAIYLSNINKTNPPKIRSIAKKMLNTFLFEYL